MQADDGEEASPPSSLTAPLGSEKCTACPVLIPLYWPLHFWLSRSGPGLPATEATASTLEKTTRLGSIFILVHGDDPKVRTTECNNTILRKNRNGWKKRHQKLVFARHYEGWEANQGFYRILSPGRMAETPRTGTGNSARRSWHYRCSRMLIRQGNLSTRGTFLIIMLSQPHNRG